MNFPNVIAVRDRIQSHPYWFNMTRINPAAPCCIAGTACLLFDTDMVQTNLRGIFDDVARLHLDLDHNTATALFFPSSSWSDAGAEGHPVQAGDCGASSADRNCVVLREIIRNPAGNRE